MKIAFHIPRLNWYRVFAPAIDEALRRGHDVVCWHDLGNAVLTDNKPIISRVPVFKFGAPVIQEYHTQEELMQLLCFGGADAVLDVRPPQEKILQKWLMIKQRPKWILHVGPDSVYTIRTKEEMFACDLIAVRTSWEMETAIEDRLKNKSELVLRLNAEPEMLGPWLSDHQKKMWESKWDEEMVNYARQRTVAVGTPSLDVLQSLDRNEIRRRWNVPQGKPVIGLLPYPPGLGAYWERLFTTTSWLKRAWIAASNGRPLDMIASVNDRAVINGIRAFCDRTGAWLVTKLKHSRGASFYVQKASNLVVSDECFYPHTATEVYAISDLVIGYYSTGSVESVAAGTFFLDVGIPYFPSDIFEEHFALYRGMFVSDGVTRTLPACTFAEGLSGFELNDFKIETNARDAYLQKYVGVIDGQSSSRLLNAVEQVIAH